MKRQYDVALIGAGQANNPLAGKLVKAGKRVALIEREHLGGSCVNFGCTPSKAVHASATLAHMIRRAGDYGLRVDALEVDYEAVMARGRAIARESRAGLQRRFDKLAGDGFSLLRGHARFAGRAGDAYRLDIDGVGTITADAVVIDTGTRTLIPDIAGLDGVACTTAETWLDMTPLPRRLLMVGGGYIGLEGGQFAQRMGSAVTIVESADQIAGHEDPDIAAAITRHLADGGIDIRTGHAVSAITRTEGGLLVDLCGGQRLEHGQPGNSTCLVEVDHLYLSPGRKPNTDDLGLDTIGLECADDGTIPVDGHRRTALPNVFAVGDITGGKMFTHNAHHDGNIVKDQLIGPGTATAEGRFVPYAMFIDPPLGRAGLTEQAARDAGHDVVCVTFDAKHNDRHRQEGQLEGVIKLVGDRQSKKLLGAACFCAGGAELVQMLQLCLAHGGDLGMITEPMFIHPILGEAILSAVERLQEELA